MWRINLYSVLCAFCLLFVMIHRRHFILAAPIHSVQGPRSSNESSLQEQHVESEHPKIVESIMDPRQAQELGSGSNMVLSTGLRSKFTSQKRKNSPMMVSEQPEASGKQRRGRAIEDHTKTRPKELTIPLARGIVDSMGRRKSNIWTVTYGDVWRDTRLAAGFLSRVPRIHLASVPLVNYYPDDRKLATVCQDKSTLIRLYGLHTFNWTTEHIYSKAFTFRKLHPMRGWESGSFDLNCHVPTKYHLPFSRRETTVLAHLRCTTIAFQRMAGFVPGYLNSYHNPRGPREPYYYGG